MQDINNSSDEEIQFLRNRVQELENMLPRWVKCDHCGGSGCVAWEGHCYYCSGTGHREDKSLKVEPEDQMPIFIVW